MDFQMPSMIAMVPCFFMHYKNCLNIGVLGAGSLSWCRRLSAEADRIGGRPMSFEAAEATTCQWRQYASGR